MARMEKDGASFNSDELVGQVKKLSEHVQGMAKRGCAVHDVEWTIWRRVLALGGEVLERFFGWCGDGDEGESLTLPNGRQVRRLEQRHDRAYQSVFGPFVLKRVVYGSRADQKIEYVPLDTRLQLPQSKFSYLLQDWDQALVVESPYAKVNATLEKILGFSQSVDSLERMNNKMAAAVPEFWETRPVSPAEDEGELLVASADGKGVPMRRPAGAPAIEAHRPKKGPKPQGKKMAILGSVYSVDRHRRTAEEVVEALFRKPEDKPLEEPSRPKLKHKRVRASLARSASGTTQPALDEVFSWMGSESRTRNPLSEKPLVLLMDGQETLWQAANASLPQEAIPILDLLHVTPRLWKAAYLFHPQRSQAAVEFVKERALRILRGDVRSVISGLRRMGTLHGLRGRKRTKLDKICGYLENNQQRMRYDQYLAAGYPIATGVIEGACRHLAKDRMERAGMRWVLSGAQAMLHLRSIHISDQWDAFAAYRIRKETERLHPFAEHTQSTEWPLAA